MTLGLAFWIVWLIALLFGGVEAYKSKNARGLVVFFLLMLLGWRVFGAPISG